MEGFGQKFTEVAIDQPLTKRIVQLLKVSTMETPWRPLILVFRMT